MHAIRRLGRERCEAAGDARACCACRSSPQPPVHLPALDLQLLGSWADAAVSLTKGRVERRQDLRRRRMLGEAAVRTSACCVASRSARPTVAYKPARRCAACTSSCYPTLPPPLAGTCNAMSVITDLN